MLVAKDISFSYEKGKTIIENFSYHFNKGESYVITGENGKGKTTLLKILLGIIKPDTGSVEKDEENIVGYVPDYNGLYEKLSVVDNVRFRLGINNKSLEDVKDKYDEWMRKYGLLNYKDTLVKNLSLGTKKKVGLLCALLLFPDIMFLDEPTGGLDDKSKKELIKILKELKKDMTLIVVTHDADYINSMDGISIVLWGYYGLCENFYKKRN